MPICYDIEIAIIRTENGEEIYDTVLSRRLIAPGALTPEQIGQEIDNFWQEFSDIMNEYDAPGRPQYQRGEGYEITSIYNC